MVRRSALAAGGRRGGAVNPEESGGCWRRIFGREPVRQHPGELSRADKCRRSRAAQRAAERQLGEAETGEPAGRGLTASGPGRPHWASR
jgi:hypothetical protein